MNPRPRLIVTLPARTVSAAPREIAEAARAGADMVEVRLDRWDDDQVERLATLFPTSLPALATLRSRAEGGEGPDDPAERRRRLTEISGLPFALVDRELARDELPGTHAKGRPPRWVGSRHFPDGTSAADLARAIAPPGDGFAFAKFVVPASVGRFLHELRPKLPEWVGPRTTVFTTGPSGPLARIWARELGQPVVFAGLPVSGDATSPGPVEPSQLPVDQLHRSWSTGEGRRFAVVGHPVGHSLSPSVHALWLARERRAACFAALDVADVEEFGLLARSEPGEPWDGWSVTAPWKIAAARLAGRPSEAVQATGVANTLTFGPDGWSAELTDAAAVQRRALELLGAGSWDGSEALVIGTGGSARAAVFALAPSRRTVRLLGRRPEAVTAMARGVGGRPADPRDPHPVGLVVHATTFGRAGSSPLVPDPSGWIGPGTTVLDFVYAADDPGLRVTAERRGGRYEDGRRLLVYQAAEAYRIWWGEAPDDAAQSVALRKVGCAA
jgi:shikimate 5-dehydrogenase/3-dehydroquinate dehydratase